MTTSHHVFLGLGGNIGDTYSVLQRALTRLELIPTVSDLAVSSFYFTSPISDIPQGPYINAVCRLKTALEPRRFFWYLQQIEQSIGRVPTKRKNAPRILDIDILFYGTEAFECPGLSIPHPRWAERLFVLRPLTDLVSSIELPDGTCVELQNLIDNMSSYHGQWVCPLEEMSLDILIGNA